MGCLQFAGVHVIAPVEMGCLDETGALAREKAGVVMRPRAWNARLGGVIEGDRERDDRVLDDVLSGSW
jgi:hypothetical protein